MLNNPDDLKLHATKVRLDGEHDSYINALNVLTGRSKAVIARKLIERALGRVHADYGIEDLSVLEVTEKVLSRVG